MLPLALAPMAELSHRALRELVASFGGCDEYFSEMLSAPAVAAGSPWEAWYLDGGPEPERFVYQIAGGGIDEIVRAVYALEEREALGIDINMGCAAPLIMRTGAGAAWLSRPAEAGRLIRAVRAATSKRLSVKLRAGGSAAFNELLAFCKTLVDEGVEQITLHPRTVKEKFKRRARWELVSALAAALNVPVAGNGDIDSAALCKKRAAESGCAALMLGRFAVQAPWVFAQAKNAAPRVINFEETALRFLELLARHQPAEFFVSRARRFFGFYAKNFRWGTWLCNQFEHAQTHAEFAALLGSYFSNNPEERTRTLD